MNGPGYRFMDPQRGEVFLSPQLLSNILSQNFAGNQWYVNETLGNDSFPGNAAQPFATLDAAQFYAKAGNGDVVVLSGTSHRTSTQGALAWAKDNVSLVALNAISNNGRGRVSASGATPFSPLVNVTAQGCSFVGLGTFHGGFTTPTGSQVCWAEAGGRNYYKACQLFGGGDAVAAALAGMRSLTVAGNGENLFEDCTIGLDTILRATVANASLELLAGTPRNVFRRPVFNAFSSDAGNAHIKVGLGGMDRYAIFQDAILHNFFGTGGAIAMDAAVVMDASAGGDILFTGRLASVGATAIATSGNVYVQADAIGATTTGIMVKAT
jgi:hypothetical protein